MTSIKWETPPNATAKGRDWVAIAEALRDRPGEWALVAEDMLRTTAAHIKSGRIVAFEPPGSFEAVTRNGGSNPRASLYVRFVGDPA